MLEKNSNFDSENLVTENLVRKRLPRISIPLSSIFYHILSKSFLTREYGIWLGFAVYGIGMEFFSF